MLVRFAKTSDIPQITDIYNDAILNTTAIWNDDPVTEENRLAWLHTHQKEGCPVLVAVNNDQTVLGYATFGQWRNFSGYRHTVEHSLYVGKTYRGHGIGKILLQKIIKQAELNGKHVMVAGIETGNTTSIGLHKA